MGMPYSRQVNAAYEQVTPLVTRGFSVARTTQKISVLLAWLQLLTAGVQAATLLALVALLVAINPDTIEERDRLVTPVIRWTASWLLEYGTAIALCLRVGVVLSIGGLGLFLWDQSKEEQKRRMEEGKEDDMLEG